MSYPSTLMARPIYFRHTRWPCHNYNVSAVQRQRIPRSIGWLNAQSPWSSEMLYHHKINQIKNEYRFIKFCKNTTNKKWFIPICMSLHGDNCLDLQGSLSHQMYLSKPHHMAFLQLYSWANINKKAMERQILLNDRKCYSF